MKDNDSKQKVNFTMPFVLIPVAVIVLTILFFVFNSLVLKVGIMILASILINLYTLQVEKVSKLVRNSDLPQNQKDDHLNYLNFVPFYTVYYIWKIHFKSRK